MVDQNVVHIGENSPQQVAYKLMKDIASAEKVMLQGINVNSNRDWILKTYCQCLRAAQNPFDVNTVLEDGPET